MRDVTDGRGNVRFGLPCRNLVSEILRDIPPPLLPPPVASELPPPRSVPTEDEAYTSEDVDTALEMGASLVSLLLLIAGAKVADKESEAVDDEQAVVVVVLAMIEPFTDVVVEISKVVALIVVEEIAVTVTVVLEMDLTALQPLDGIEQQVALLVITTDVADVDDDESADEAVVGTDSVDDVAPIFVH